jgi:hypothetical protein
MDNIKSSGIKAASQETIDLTDAYHVAHIVAYYGKDTSLKEYLHQIEKTVSRITNKHQWSL